MKRLSLRGAVHPALLLADGEKNNGANGKNNNNDNNSYSANNEHRGHCHVTFLSKDAKQFSCNDLLIFDKEDKSQCWSNSSRLSRRANSTSRTGLRHALSESMDITLSTVSRANSVSTHNTFLPKCLQLHICNDDGVSLLNTHTAPRERDSATRAFDTVIQHPLHSTDIHVNKFHRPPPYTSLTGMREDQTSVDVANVANSVVVKNGNIEIDAHEASHFSLPRAMHDTAQDKPYNHNNDDLDVVNMIDPDDSFEDPSDVQYFETALKQATFTPHTPFTMRNISTPTRMHNSHVGQRHSSFSGFHRYDSSMKSIVFDSDIMPDNEDLYS